jgi:TPR repeat protein
MHHLLVGLLSLYIFLGLGPKVPNKALQLTIDNAENGDLSAQLDLIDHYRNGKGVEVDTNLTFRYAQMAARQGDTEAQQLTATMLLDGVGTNPNPQEATIWLKKAADKGSTQAQHDLGYCYSTGMGTKKDNQKANSWWLKAAHQDYKPSQHNLANSYYLGRGVKQNLKEAAIWAYMSGNKSLLEKLRLELNQNDMDQAKISAFQKLKEIRISRIKHTK